MIVLALPKDGVVIYIGKEIQKKKSNSINFIKKHTLYHHFLELLKRSKQ